MEKIEKLFLQVYCAGLYEISSFTILVKRVSVVECFLIQNSHKHTHTHTSNWPPGRASLTSNSTPRSFCLSASSSCEPISRQCPGTTLYKLPLHLTCPGQLSIIDEWVALRGGGGGPGGEESTEDRYYYLNELTAPRGDTAR